MSSAFVPTGILRERERKSEGGREGSADVRAENLLPSPTVPVGYWGKKKVVQLYKRVCLVLWDQVATDGKTTFLKSVLVQRNLSL